MQGIKRQLFSRLGRRRYLFLVSRLYFLAYRMGWLRRNPEYEIHYFVRNLVREGDQVIDIGANLGYYTVIFSDLVGKSGRVWSVEPVPLYSRILKSNIGNRTNIEVLPFALGEKTGTVRMGIPGDQPYRHGLTRVLNEGEGDHIDHTYEVAVRTPDELFASLDRLDYIKCDVEGYEIHIIPQMMGLINRFRPVVQVELAGENRKPLFTLFSSRNYRAFYVAGQKLRSLGNATQKATGDTIFIPSEKVERFADHLDPESADGSGGG